MRKIMFGNEKGGVGKTVSAVSIAHALTLLGKRVLLVDADPQGNSSRWLQPPNAKIELADVIAKKTSFDKAITKTEQGFDMVVTFPDGDLRKQTEAELSSEPFLFDDLFAKVNGQYDFLIADTSPAFSPLERGICTACDEVMCPVELEFFAVDGLGQFDQDIRKLDKSMRKKTLLNKIILTKENRSYSRHKLLHKKITENKGYEFFSVRQDSLIAETIGLNQTIFERNNKAKSAVDYMKIAKGMI